MPSSDSDGVQVSSDVLSAVAVGVRERPVVALHVLEAGDVRVRGGGHAVVHRAARVTGIVVACLTMPTTAGTGSKELNEINRVGALFTLSDSLNCASFNTYYPPERNAQKNLCVKTRIDIFYLLRP